MAKVNPGEMFQSQIDYWASDRQMVGGWSKSGLDIIRTDAIVGGPAGSLHRRRRRPCYAPVDYVGSFNQKGVRVAVYVEAKAMRQHNKDWMKTPFPLGDPRRVRPWQRDHLNAMVKTGAVAFYFVWVYDQWLSGRYVAIHPLVAEKVLAESKKKTSVTLGELRAAWGCCEIEEMQILPLYVRGQSLLILKLADLSELSKGSEDKPAPTG